MNDNEIISLFFERNENAIKELSKKYHAYCYQIAWNLLAIDDVQTTINEKHLNTCGGSDYLPYTAEDLLDYNGSHWNFKTGFWGAYEPEVRENATTPKPALPDPDSEYVELQLYIKSNVFSLDDVGEMMDDDSFSSELSETEFFEQDDTDPFGTETDFILENFPAQDDLKGFGESDDENDYGWEKIGEKVRIPLK